MPRQRDSTPAVPLNERIAYTVNQVLASGPLNSRSTIYRLIRERP